MSARAVCRACGQPIVVWSARLLTCPTGPAVLNDAIGAHVCGQGPLCCQACGHAIAASHNLPDELIAAARSVHRRYCRARLALTQVSPQNRTRRKATA